MEKYYRCELRGYYNPDYEKTAHILLYNPLLGATRRIPIILVEDDEKIFEFFTKTEFEKITEWYSSIFHMPNSTLTYFCDCSAVAFYSVISPAEALKTLQPYLKKKEKIGKKVYEYFSYFKQAYQKQLEENNNRNQQDIEASSILSKFWEK